MSMDACRPLGSFCDSLPVRRTAFDRRVVEENDAILSMKLSWFSECVAERNVASGVFGETLGTCYEHTC